MYLLEKVYKYINTSVYDKINMIMLNFYAISFSGVLKVI
jgi:hypothetical protein